MSPISMPLALSLLGLAAFSAIATRPLSASAQIAPESIAQTPVQIVPANPLPAPTPGSSPPIEEPPAEDLDLEEIESELPEPEPLVSPAAEGSTTTYADEGMSFDFPADWQVEMIENGLMIANVTTVESELVATQLVRMAAPPGPVVNANIDSFIEEGSAVGRYRTVDIDGQEALVMWLADRPDELTGAIATFIGYGDETILIFSRYSPENETAEADILRLHTSFANLAAGSETEDAAIRDAEDESPSL